MWLRKHAALSLSHPELSWARPVCNTIEHLIEAQGCEVDQWRGPCQEADGAWLIWLGSCEGMTAKMQKQK